MKLLSVLFGVLSLTVVGTAASHVMQPEVPRWLDSSKYGFGYLMSKSKSGNGGVVYEGYTELSYDFDYDCMRNAFSNYTDYTFTESVLCQGTQRDYSSAKDSCTYKDNQGSVETIFTTWLQGFVSYLGDGMLDPVWRKRSDFSVIKNPTTKQLLYIRQSDKAVQFLVDNSDSEKTYIQYFPTGIKWDQDINGVWDFNFKYGYCPSRVNSFFENKKSVFSMLSGSEQKYSHMSPVFPSMPEGLLDAEPANIDHES
jgi:hypothetical protein